MAGEAITFKYRFVFSDDKEREFLIRVDKDNLEVLPEDHHLRPAWTDLSFQQCPNCPLDPSKHKTCPAALSLYKPIVIFKDFVSYADALVTVETEFRTYRKQVPLHVGLSSMVGIYMATSGCPILKMLRPMVRFHLPFANEDETSYRALSMYLMAQFLLSKSGGKPDWELKGLGRLYEDITTVNKHFISRLQNMPIKDASTNAVLDLDCFATFVSFAVNQDMLDDLKNMFRMYLPG